MTNRYGVQSRDASPNPASGLNEWHETFSTKASKLIEPCDERWAIIRERGSPVQVYAFRLAQIDGCFKKLDEFEHTSHDLSVRVSILDMSYKQFIGRTWEGPFKVLKVNKSGGAGPTGSINYDETVYLSTAIDDEHVIFVIELVVRPHGSDAAVSIGWSAFRPFSANNETDATRLGVYFGTPRSLLFMDDPFEKCKYLKEITGLYIHYSFKLRPKLLNFQKFIPENVLLGRNDKIGGVIDESGVKNPLERPRLSNQMSFIVDDLYVYLYPNVTKFENEFCKLIAEDKSIWNKIEIEPLTINIFERRLKIGVHNGWKFISEPHVIHLSVDDQALQTQQQQQQMNASQQPSKLKRLSLRSSMRPPRATDQDSDSSNQPTRLFMRNSVVLNELFEDPLCTIVFEVEYVINVPIHVNIMNTINKKNMANDVKKQYETHHIAVRWATFSPFSNSPANYSNQMRKNVDDITSRIDLNLFGNNLVHSIDRFSSNVNQYYNPSNVLVFKCPDTNMQDKLSSKQANGKMSFEIKKGNQITFKAPRYDEDLEQTNQMASQLHLPTDLHETRPGFGHDSYRSRSGPVGGQMDSARQYMSDMQHRSIMDVYNQMMPKPDENIQTSQGNLLMNQLVTRASDSQRLIGLFGGNLDLYPIYNPSLHMPVLALAPGQMGGRTMSRAAYAKLQGAKFAPIVDRNGHMAEVIDGNSYLQFDLQREEADPLSCNQIIIQFLAFSRSFQTIKSGKSEGKPSSVYFTFQFYRFPEFKTPRLVLDKIMEDYSMDTESTPFILKQIDDHPNKINHPEHIAPGYMISYSVDPTNLKFGEKKLFLQYLAQHAMFIDVWDGDSLHLIGTATLQLKELLRHGKEAVQCTYELDIISTEYDDDTRTNSGNTFREGVPYPCDTHIKQQGFLHIRVGNIGSPVADYNEPDLNPTPIAPAVPFTRVIASKSSLNAYGESLLAQKIDEATAKGFVTHNISKAHHMTDTFKDIHAALVASKSNKNLSDANDAYDHLDPRRKRKLLRMQMVRQALEQNQNLPPQITSIGVHRRIIQDRDKDLRIMEFYRNQTKHDQIMNKLHEFITTEYAIYPNFGITEFFEFVITNPYNEAQAITIVCEDPEVHVVTNSREWRHLKLINQIYSQVEDNMFNREAVTIPGDVGTPRSAEVVARHPQVYLRPKETINIPLKFQTFRANSSPTITVAGQGEHRSHDPNDMNSVKAVESSVIRYVKNTYDIRKTNIYFRAQDGNPIAILRLVIDQQPHVVNQTIRYYECEHSFLKRVVRLPSSTVSLAAPPLQSISQSQSHTQPMVNSDVRIDGTSMEQGISQLFVRASDPNVVCESRPVNIGEPHDVFIKVATGASPNIKSFSVAIYADQYLAVPVQIWQIYVHSLMRIDVSCFQGQTSRFSLILKGTQSSRVVKCYPSAPEEMAVSPGDKFMLASGAVQELNVGIQPSRSGSKHYYLNVVDIEMSQLVHSWFINANVKPPVISKAFEMTLPVSTSSTSTLSANNTIQKRISYTNPYSNERIFVFSTNRDDLLAFKERRIKFAANEAKAIGLKLLPNPLSGFVEILVFINNDGTDTNEETFSLRCHYVKQQQAY